MKIFQATRCQSIPGGLLLLALLVLPVGAFAQGGGRSLLEHLEEQDVQAELNLSAAQQLQLDELRASLNDRSDFTEMMKKSTQVTSDEERSQLREQMRNYAANRRQQAEEQLKSILSAEQLTKLEQIALQERGVRALADGDVAARLELTDEQKQAIADLASQRAAARSEAELETDEQIDQFEGQWDARYAAILTDEQQQQWARISGKPISGAALAPLAVQPSLQTPLAPGSTDGGPISSFGAPRRTTNEPRDPEKLYFTFQNSPWSEVLPLFAEAAGLTLDLHAIPPGTFSHIDNRGYSVTEALDVINGYLLARGYILVRREGGFLVSVRIDDPNGIPPNLVPTVSVSELPTRGRYELLTVVFPVPSDDDIDAIASEVEKLVGRQGKVVGVKPTRSIVVTDIGANLQRINELLRSVTGGPEDPVFKEYALEHILADDAEFLVRTLLGLSTDPAGAAAASAASAAASEEQRRREERASRFSRGGSGFTFGGRQPTQAPTTSGATTRSGSKANTIADPRTNKLLVSATPSEHRIIEEALKTVDVAERSPLASDRPYGAMGDKQMTVIGLSNMDATSAALMLQSMFLKEGDSAPTISANTLARQLIVRGSEAQVYQIKQLLMELGEDGSGQRTAGNRGPVRSVNLSGRDPSEILPILERMWASQRGSTLRVVVPGATDTTAEDNDEQRRSQLLRDLQQRLQQPQADPRPERPERPGADDEDSRTGIDGPVSTPTAEDLFTVGTEAPQIDHEDGTSFVQAPAAEPRSIDQGDVTLRIVGDELMIISQDEQALDELELMIENVMRAVPPRTTWSIFPLKSADATEAAAMLEQLFPDSRVSQSSSDSGGTLGALTSGISSFGSGVASLTGLSELGSGPQTLRIIPETRLNALWVAGPAYKVQEVEQMLEIIDSSGLTDSLRDRIPRLIPVLHADIEDVFEIVSSVYAPEMQAIGAQGGDPRQAFAAMLGGRRGGGDDENDRNAQARVPQITLGVDKDTSHLIVSANDATFVEIEELVASIDVAAQSARRSVMVRQLVNTNASTVQGSLTSIIPKVTVSTTGSNARPSSSSSSSGGQSQGSSSSSDDEAARRRAEFFQRMREQGGGGFSPFGGGGDRGGSDRSGRGGGDRGGRGGGDRGGR
jgi:type II secretory pathway component GspD/PulD (secretin)